MKNLLQIHTQILISGLHIDSSVTDEIIHFCVFHPQGSLNYGRLLIENSDDSLPSSWNNLIRGYAASKSVSARGSISIFLAMRRSDTRPNKLTYPFLFKACSTLLAYEEGKQIHADVLKHGVDFDVYVQNTMIHFYGSCGKIIDARQVFDGMLYRTYVSWNSIISACVVNSKFLDSVKYFTNMRDCGYEPDETAMVVLLSAFDELGNLSLGKWVHAQLILRGLILNCELGTALVDMYAKCGALDYSRLVFDRISERNVWTWSAMVLGLAQHGFATEALEYFSRMKKSLIQPNYVTFLGVLCACSHAGLVEDGIRFFLEMKRAYGIKPMIVHYGAMVDVLGRAGRLKEAYNFIMNMPIQPDPTVWRTLLSACSIYDINDNAEIGETVRKRLLELEPRRGANLVMVANNYAEIGMWEKATHVRRSMRSMGLKKMAGESCVEVGGSMYKFLSGDDSHVDSEHIFLLLNQLNFHMKMVSNE